MNEHIDMTAGDRATIAVIIGGAVTYEGKVMPRFFEWLAEAQKHFRVVLVDPALDDAEDRNNLIAWFANQVAIDDSVPEGPLQVNLSNSIHNIDPAPRLVIGANMVGFDGTWRDNLIHPKVLCAGFKLWWEMDPARLARAVHNLEYNAGPAPLRAIRRLEKIEQALKEGKHPGGNELRDLAGIMDEMQGRPPFHPSMDASGEDEDSGLLDDEPVVHMEAQEDSDFLLPDGTLRPDILGKIVGDVRASAGHGQPGAELSLTLTTRVAEGLFKLAERGAQAIQHDSGGS